MRMCGLLLKEWVDGCTGCARDLIVQIVVRGAEAVLKKCQSSYAIVMGVEKRGMKKGLKGRRKYQTMQLMEY